MAYLNRDVIIIGGGAVGLNTALFANFARPKYDVHLYTANEDPRLVLGKKSLAEISATFGGGPTRMLTLKEGEPYFDGVGGNDDSQNAFRDALVDSGWLFTNRGNLTTAYSRWIESRHKFAATVDPGFAAHLRKNHYARANASSLNIIAELRQEIPQLFEGASYSEDGILRIYDTPDLFDEALRVQTELGAVKSILTVEELRRKYPIYNSAIDEGKVGGAMIVKGRSINIHAYFINLINYLESEGIVFHWNSKVAHVDFKTNYGDRYINKLCLEDGREIQGKHIIMCPGAYSTELFADTNEPGAVTGVAGVWSIIELKNGEDFPIPATKIHGVERHDATGKFPFIDINAIPAEIGGKKYIILGSGYVGLGHPPYDLKDGKVEAAFAFARNEMHRMAEIMFGDFYRDAKAEGRIDYCLDKACVRSFTKDDVPTHLKRQFSFKTKDGGIGLIHAGDNTGSFSESFSDALGVLEHMRNYDNRRAIA